MDLDEMNALKDLDYGDLLWEAIRLRIRVVEPVMRELDELPVVTHRLRFPTADSLRLAIIDERVQRATADAGGP